MPKTIKTQMERKLFKRSAIAACVMTAFAVQAQAQDNEDPAILEEVVVYGIKQSLQNAQSLKRQAATVKDVVTASDITSLPDKSVVEALSRVPGISVENFKSSDDPEHFGAEGSSALIRGLTRVRTEFNGRSVFSARSSGGLNFSDVPPELVGSMEVVKNQTAESIEGGIAGTINLITRKPFDSDERILGGSIKSSYGELSEAWTPEVSGVFSDRWDTDAGEFGVLFNLSSSELESRTEGVGLHNFYEKSKAGAELDAAGNIEYSTDKDRNGNLIATAKDGSIGIPIPGREDQVSYLPPSVQIRFQDTERKRTGFASSFQWENPDDTILATLEYIRSDSKLSWTERVIENKDSLGDSLGNRNASTLLEVAGVSGADVSFDSNGQFTNGYLTSPGGYLALTRARNEESLVNDFTFNVKFSPNDNLVVNTDLQYVDAKAEIFDFVVHSHFNSDVYVDARGDTPSVEFVGFFDPSKGTKDLSGITDPSKITLRSAMDHQAKSVGEQLAFAVDGEYSFDDSWITSIKGGVRFTDKEQTHQETDYDWGVISPEWADDAGRSSAADFPELFEQIDFTNDFRGGDVLSGQSSFIFPHVKNVLNPFAFESYIHQSGAFKEGSNGDMFGLQATKNSNTENGFFTPYLPTETFVVTEKRASAFGQLNFEFNDNIRGNLGLRYVSVDLESTGSMTFSELSGRWQAAGATAPGFVDLDQSTYEYSDGSQQVLTASPETYSKVLPSFNIVYNITDDILIRFGASQAIFVPELQDLRNAIVVNTRTETKHIDPSDTDSLITDVDVTSYEAESVGDSNPFLKPEESINVDLSAEWYFSDIGSLTLAVFNKDIENMIRVNGSERTITNETTGVTQVVNYAGKDNVGDATVKGYELAYQQTFDMLPEPFNGLGMMANYTYVDAEEDFEGTVDNTVFGTFGNLPLEGLSEDTFNIATFYENNYFSTRLAYNWRSEYLLNSRGAITKSPIYNADRGVLDFSFSFNISDSIKVGFDINNLLDEQTETMVQIDEDGTTAPRNFFIQDRRYSLRVTGNF